MHLFNKQQHDDKCTPDGCTQACGFAQLEAWLDAPLTRLEQREEERIRQRRQALLRGEIPA